MNKVHLIKEWESRRAKTQCGLVGDRMHPLFTMHKGQVGRAYVFRALTEEEAVYNDDEGLTCNKCREITNRRKII